MESEQANFDTISIFKNEYINKYESKFLFFYSADLADILLQFWESSCYVDLALNIIVVVKKAWSACGLVDAIKTSMFAFCVSSRDSYILSALIKSVAIKSEKILSNKPVIFLNIKGIPAEEKC